jgi:hypothetical protein
MVDAADLKSASCKGVWVRVPPSAVAKMVRNFLKLGCYPQLIHQSKVLGTFRVSVAPFAFVPLVPQSWFHRSQGM